MVTATKAKTNGQNNGNGKAARSITDNSDPRNRDKGGGGCADYQGIEHGCPARIGAYVMDGDGPTGLITGFTDQLVIFRDPKTGEEYAQRYGHCMTITAPPEGINTGELVSGSTSVNGSPGLIGQLRDRRYHELALKVIQLMLELESIPADQSSLEGDHYKASELLEEAWLKLTELDDNRMIVLAREARQDIRNNKANTDTEAA